MKKILCALVGATALFAGQCQAWWNSEWSHRAQITLSGAEGVPGMPVLIRMHTGNFNFVGAREDGSDLRFVGADDKTLLRHHLEKFDALNELALVWVQLPPAGKSAQLWLYYGNDKASGASDMPGTYDASQVLAYHFAETSGAPQDQTANGNHAAQFPAARSAAAIIGEGMSFNGAEKIAVPAAPAFKFGGGTGFTFSAWVKSAAPQKDAVLFRLQDSAQTLAVFTQGTQVAAVAGAVKAAGGELMPGNWHHVAVTADQRLSIFIDGKEVAAADGALPAMQGGVIIGDKFKGDMDEAGVANVARAPAWIAAAARSQGPDASFAAVGVEESANEGGGTSYLGTILHSVTTDGWVVIILLAVMAAISWMVMLSKALVIKKTEKGNSEFLQAFHQLKLSDTGALDSDETSDEDIQDSPVLLTLFGRHDHYQHSSVYTLYHAGVQEIRHRFGGSVSITRTLSPQSIDAIRATLDAALVRETQKLNSLMVLLTIAISGGPFLGLLGTVVGVMITFAAIAATGDVNVAAIAPGIAAALVATVAGLAVAIPALFGYNYLGSRIKNVSADMRVFADEFVTRIAENYSGAEQA